MDRTEIFVFEGDYDEQWSFIYLFPRYNNHWQSSLKSKLLRMIPIAKKGDKG